MAKLTFPTGRAEGDPLGVKVRKAREGKALSRDRLAAEVGVSVSTVVRLENHNQLPGTEAIAAIARTLGLSLDDLLGVTA